mmetsp:Transcript_118364/g.339732  ORF Transcript_118364/g.339732 Transcript_118364/m.339732 type:complete len:538 (-) Transcript_118364:380-1993(-)
MPSRLRTPRWLLASLSLLLPGAASTAPDAEKVQVDPQTGFFRDGHGRVRIFHGMNVVFKEAPWYPPSDKFNPEDSFDSVTMDLLRKWGFNAVRLGVMWPGVEPTHGLVDHAYLHEMTRFANMLSERGIYTVIDLHQDLGSRQFCGEGFPEHYIEALARDPNSTYSRAPPWPSPLPFKFPPLNETGGVPRLEDCLKHSFGEYYLTERVGAVWRELYTPGTALRSGFLRYWDAVATAFRDEVRVLGYELLNEPSGYCLEGGPLSCRDAVHALGNYVERTYLTPLYQAAAERIRALDKSTPIFFEATVVPKVSDAFPAVPLPNETQQVFGYHIYCAPGDGRSGPAGFLCRTTQDTYTHLYYGFLRKHRGVGGFMTEFGAIGGSPRELEHLGRLLDLADGMFQSWTYWMLKLYRDFTTANAAQSLYDDQGRLETEKLAALSRTFAPAIAGTPSRMHFDVGSGGFELTYVADVTSAPTVVYVNEELNYPGGFAVEEYPSECLNRTQTEPNYLNFQLTEVHGCRGSTVSIRIWRKPATSELVV